MCGIAGIVVNRRASFPVTRHSLQKMADSLAHRGPDGEGFFIGEGDQSAVGMAHRRLAVIDLTPASAQPLHYLDRYVVVHNGEIYNDPELRQELKAKGCVFRSTGDAELIAAAYHHFGPSCVASLEGMFAFAVWDKQSERLFAARDRFGEKPFYYWHDQTAQRLFFASEMKALWAAGIPRKTRPQSMLHFLTLGITQHPEIPGLTFYEDIWQLPPAHSLCFDAKEGVLEITRYWDLDKQSAMEIGAEEAIRRFRELLDRSIRQRLRSDVAIGCSLSGGIDSTTIAASIKNSGLLPSPQAFSAVFPGFEKDERIFIEAASEKLGWPVNYTLPDAETLLADCRQLVRHQEEPFGSASIYAQFAVHRLAKAAGVTVMLDGQGADEILGGYTKYSHWYLQESLAKKSWKEVTKEARMLKANGFLTEWGFRNRLSARFPALTATLLEKRARQQHRAIDDISDSFREAWSGGGFLHKPIVEKLNDILYYDTCMGPLQTLLRHADRNAMAHGIEVRLPFLDHTLVSFVFSLPGHLKIKEGLTKWILQQSYRSSIPDIILARKGKTGFEPPQALWMSHPLFVAQIRQARENLVDAGMLKAAVLKKPVEPTPAYAADNRDWRYWNAAQFL